MGIYSRRIDFILAFLKVLERKTSYKTKSEIQFRASLELDTALNTSSVSAVLAEFAAAGIVVHHSEGGYMITDKGKSVLRKLIDLVNMLQ